ncbi:hypothetical protein SNEBB_001834 [Seison nebaliae]|nr:hypothetical protein SNEBB_001834 [Seison nebaliae]
MRNLPSSLKFLYQKKIKPMPIWNVGDPKRRLFFPMFWMRPMNPEYTNQKLPDDVAKFEVHLQMSKLDVKQYLEKVYDIDVLDVNTQIVEGKENKHPVRKTILPPDAPRKYAYVQLRNETFEFPDIFEKNGRPSEKAEDEMKEMRKELDKNELPKSNLIPSWFNN